MRRKILILSFVFNCAQKVKKFAHTFMEYLGNKEILKNYKIGFLCSRKVPASIILKTYDWAIEQRDNRICVVSGFHSKIEMDVFDILLKGTQPLILVIARSMKKRWEERIFKALKVNRLLIVSPFNSNTKRITKESSLIRNKYILSKSDKIFIPYTSPSGMLTQILKPFQDKIISLNSPHTYS